jgi:hypothetical protein
MNLGKLLFAGKSVVNGSAAVSYRENKQVALPKFGSPKNPFAPAKKETAPDPEAARKQPPISSTPKSLAVWTTRLAPSSFWGGAAATEQKAPTPVQTELSLDTVKVVHNDLSDADVEVVPIKSRPAAAGIPALSPAKKSWEIMGERLLRATAL